MSEPKGYWIARIDVRDEAVYPGYIAAATPAYERFGARFIIRGGTFEPVEGSSRARNVVIEFPTYQAALDCYRSPEYTTAKAIRQSCSDGDILIIAGYAPPAA